MPALEKYLQASMFAIFPKIIQAIVIIGGPGGLTNLPKKRGSKKWEDSQKGGRKSTVEKGGIQINQEKFTA